jgi:hypothetical protein
MISLAAKNPMQKHGVLYDWFSFSPSVIESITTREVPQYDVICMEELKAKNSKDAAWKTNKSREL